MRLANLKLVLPEGILDNGYIDLEDGFIADIGQDANQYDIDGQGCYALPGLIDLHGDMIERDVEPRPKAYFPTELALLELDKRLAALGITTAYAAISFAEARKMAYLRSEERARDTIHLINSLKDELLVDMRIHARFEITNHSAPKILHELLEQEHIDLISLNDHTPGQGQYRDLETHIKHVAAWRGISEDAFRVEVLERLERLSQNPPSWDVIHGICEEARKNGIVIASHDDDTVDKVDLITSLGASLSEFPVTMEAAREAKRRGLFTLMGAPNAYRGQSNTGNLSAMEALKEGLVDILASDYYPAAMLHMVFKLTADGTLPLHEAVKLVSSHPANAAGLFDRGSLELEKRADIALVETSPGHLPRVRASFSKGKPIFWDGKLGLARLAPQKVMVNA